MLDDTTEAWFYNQDRSSLFLSFYLDDDDIFGTTVHGRQEPILQTFGKIADGLSQRSGNGSENVWNEHLDEVLIELIISFLDKRQNRFATR